MANSPTTRRQNARRLMILQGITTVQAAELIGVDPAHLGNCLSGRTRPLQVVRDKLPAILGVALEECFDAELLAKEYGGRRGLRARRPLLSDSEGRNDA